MESLASACMPPIAQPFVSDRARRVLDQVQKFVEEECIPADSVYTAQLGEGDQRWRGHPSVIDVLKKKAKDLGIWNLFLPSNLFREGPQFTNIEYALMAEQMGRSINASEACNCSAPDTGNMEVIARYGTPAQKEKWLKPLLAGEIRSAFLMTEPDVASSDALNISLRMERRGDHYLLNGSKWWSSGAGDDRCKVFITFGKTSPNHPNKYQQQTMMLIAADTPGITIKRMLSVYGFDDAPHGHAHLTFTNVRVPLDSVLLGEGRGNEIMQGRLGPGRIHHAMRAVGASERALELLIHRLNDERKVPFGQPLVEHGVLLEWVAKARIEIDATRLVVLNAAIKADQKDTKFALREIAEAKVKAPQVALQVIDRAIQVHGAMGVCQDTPLPKLWTHLRTLQIADGPDEAHLRQLGRRETREKKNAIKAKIEGQKARTEAILGDLGVKRTELGAGKFQVKGKL